MHKYYTGKNAQVVTDPITSCRQVVFALLGPIVVVTSLEQVVNNMVYIIRLVTRLF